MVEDVEALVKKQQLIDDQIELAIAKTRRRHRVMIIALAILSAGILAALGAIGLNKLTTPGQGADDYYSRAVTLREEGDWIGAAREFRRALSFSPDHVEARWSLGLTHLTLGEGESAEKELRHARSLGHSGTALSVALLEAMLLQRRYTEVVVETVSTGVESGDIRMLLIQGKAQMGLDQLDKAWETFGETLEIEPDNIPALLAMTRVSLATADLASAETTLARALKLDPQRMEGRVLAGRLALKQGKFAEARREFGEAASHSQGMPEANLGIAQAFLAEGKPGAAEEYLDKVVETASQAPEPKYLRAVVALQRGELPTARNSLRSLLEHSPQHLDGLLLMAKVNHSQQQHRQAENVLNRLLKSNPTITDARVLLASIQLEMAEPEQAIETLSDGETVPPGHGQVFALLARAYTAIDQPEQAEQAEEYLQKASQQESTAESDSVLGSASRRWELSHCGTLIHFCRQCLYLRECG